ncbi:hypothetical protein CTheo_4410 [Ceratobasidium theobromae]|uniref:Ricin B lectin domain-containing protein n=1 Tax=Ceratobasidium theobromae TaxID=1582974 RepID=A0A5N5QK67_9AGAM|nr:hypothetical protein CTheo_4410 [Ceratobasidium theobromae]
MGRQVKLGSFQSTYSPILIAAIDMRFLVQTFTLGVLLASSMAQQLPENEQTYRIAELNPFNRAASMAVRARDSNIIVNNFAPTADNKLSQHWVIKDLNTQDNTTALWNPQKEKYAGYSGTPTFDTTITLVDTPTKFQLIYRRGAGFWIAIPNANQGSNRLVMVRGPLGTENRVILRPQNTRSSSFQTWNFTTPA